MKKREIRIVIETAVLLAFVLVAALVLPRFEASEAGTTASGPRVIMTTPSSDPSKSVTVSWYDTAKKGRLVYTKANDTSFKKAKTKKTTGTEMTDEAFYEFDAEHSEEFPELAGKTLYRHTVTLKKLKADTEYIYKVVSGKKESSVKSFKTAGKDGEFSFAWFADLHADPREDEKLPLFNRLMKNVDKAAGGKADLVLFSGDLVKFGNMYTAWTVWDSLDAMRGHLFAPIPGNKEYYRLTDYSEDSKTKYYSGEWFENTVTVPGNGVDGIEGTYYFIYDNVMFVSLNSCRESDSRNKNPYDGEASVEAQKAWLKDIVAKEAGKFDYLVVQEHYSFFYHDYDDDRDYACDWYDTWRDTFDECKVDIALSADVHAYCRSKQLYKDKETKDKDCGTVYLTYSELLDYRMDDKVKKGMDKRVASYIKESINCGGLFEVTPEKITFSLIDYEGKVIDSTEVPKKNR